MVWLETNSLRSQFVILDSGRGRYRKYLPYVFTERGVAMLSSVFGDEGRLRLQFATSKVVAK